MTEATENSSAQQSRAHKLGSEPAGTERSHGTRAAGRVKLASLAIIAISVLVLLRELPVEAGAAALRNWVARLGVWGPVAFGSIYALGTVFAVPGLILTISAGALFGLWTGFITASLASTTGAGLAFLAARHLARARVKKAADSHPLFGAIDAAIGEGDWRIVALLRLSPVVPFNLQNYMFGLTPVPFRNYLLTSWIAMMPGTFLYVYVGHLTGAAATSSGRSAGEWALLAVGLVATIAVSWYLTRLARRQLAARDGRAGLTADAGAGRAEPSNSEPDEPTRPWGAAIAALAALLFGATAAASLLQPDLLSRALPFGPPEVALTEEYSHRPSGVSFDHSTFDRLLRRHVDGGGWVDYAGLARDARELDSYLDQLALASCDELGRDEKLAFLINTYNAATLRLVLDNFPLDSIRDIPAAQRWNDERWSLDGRMLSLDQIEHEEIRGHFAEPRIHFAVVCAAVGCPPLRNEAFTGPELGRQLEDQTRTFHSYGTWVDWNPENRTLGLSPLYNWYRSDFEQVSGSIEQYAMPYVAGMESAEGVDVEWLDYDWSLNDMAHFEER